MADEIVPQVGPFVTRAQAKAWGLPRYFTGKECPHGHFTVRRTINSACCICIAIAQNAFCKANRAQLLEKERAYYAQPHKRERRRARMQQWADGLSGDRAAKRVADQKERSREFYARNRAKLIKRTADWKVANPEKRKVNDKRYEKRHPETRINMSHRRRVRKMSAPEGSREAVRNFLRWLKTAEKVRCYWCKSVVPKKARHADHVIPLAKGGAHEAANLCAACATCNFKKSAKMPEDFSGQAELSFAA